MRDHAAGLLCDRLESGTGKSQRQRAVLGQSTLGDQLAARHDRPGRCARILLRKSNLERLRGIEAITGRSNFDISESVLQTLLLAMRPDQDSLAMLIKTATARKVLRFAWSRGMQFSHASMHEIDADESFGVSCDACLLLLRPSDRAAASPLRSVTGLPDLDSDDDVVGFGWSDGRLVSDPEEAEATQHLQGAGGHAWRSGVKHDVAGVLELTEQDGSLFSRDGRQVDIEFDRVYPLAKGADVANRQNRLRAAAAADSAKDNERTHRRDDDAIASDVSLPSLAST